MGGSLEWVTCPVCEYENACADFELKDRSTKIYCAGCGYASEHGLVFHFLYRNEFKITVIAKDKESALAKIDEGKYLNIKIDST